MRRREFITLVSGVAFTLPLAARAQQPERMKRIGVLMNISETDPSAPVFIATFRQQLQELGWLDGRNARIETRWASGSAEHYRRYAAELAALAPWLRGTAGPTVIPARLKLKPRKLTMTRTTETLPAETAGTDITRFNALRHGVLSRYTVLPWENADEYQAIVSALAAEHVPQGPTEEHLVEEIAGIMWRKRRLRLAEAAAHRRGLEGTLASYRETVKVALVHLDTTGQSERVVDAIRATVADTTRTSPKWRQTRP